MKTLSYLVAFRRRSSCRDFLRGAGCEYAQGYFLGRPADHEYVSTLLAAPA
jgi:EAL domain-containing protein (putative c-di-GMP-specific phosphodiesterase class I)